MTKFTVTIYRCPECSFMTNRPGLIKKHEDLSCAVKMEHFDLNYKYYSKCIELEVEGKLKIDVFI